MTEEIYKKPVIVYNYPKDIKAFYMRLNDDEKTVAAMDVLVPKVGLGCGVAARECDWWELDVQWWRWNTAGGENRVCVAVDIMDRVCMWCRLESWWVGVRGRSVRTFLRGGKRCGGVDGDRRRGFEAGRGMWGGERR